MVRNLTELMIRIISKIILFYLNSGNENVVQTMIDYDSEFWPIGRLLQLRAAVSCPGQGRAGTGSGCSARAR